MSVEHWMKKKKAKAVSVNCCCNEEVEESYWRVLRGNKPQILDYALLLWWCSLRFKASLWYWNWGLSRVYELSLCVTRLKKRLIMFYFSNIGYFRICPCKKIGFGPSKKKLFQNISYVSWVCIFADVARRVTFFC